MNRSRRAVLLFGARIGCATVFALAGCVSNPTPHPANDGAQETRGDDVGAATPTDEASCEDLGGFWSGDGCYESDAPDAALLDVTTPGNVDALDGAEVDGAEVDTTSDGDVGPSD